MENNNALQVFNYEGNNEVRTIEENGDIWFVAKDIAQALGYGRFDSNLIKSVPEIWKGTKRIRTPGGMQAMTCISEQGLYFFLGRSDKKAALTFQMWLAGEVLPQIRKTGAYVPDKALNDPAFVKNLSERITAIQEANDQLRDQIARDQAATTFGKIMLGLPNGMDFHKAAQLLAQQGFPIGRNRLYKKARDKKWLCQQKKIRNQPTQGAVQQGLVGWQSEIIDGQYSMVVALTVKGFSKLFEELTKEHRPIIYLIDRAEAFDAKALKNGGNKKTKTLSN